MHEQYELPDDMPEPDGAELELLMPFVVCESHGGPYDDDAFCAGWELGLLDAALAHNPVGMSAAVEMKAIVRSASLPQIDLLAMKHGWIAKAEVDDEVPEWASVTFTKDA